MYRVVFERPDGSKGQTSIDPFESRHMAALSLLPVFVAESVRGVEADRIPIGEAKVLAKRCMDADLGDFVTHEPSGYTFTTEEF